MSCLKLTSPMCPSVNHYLASHVVMKNVGNKKVPMSVTYETNEAKKYKKDFTQYVKEQINIQGWDMPVTKEQHFYVDVVFYFDRIDKDPNNYFKLPIDAITESGLIWADDNVVCERVNRIYYDAENPRMEYTIYPVDYIGIFDNKLQLNRFEDECKTCKRFSKNCSILKKAKEGRIQKEINEHLECSKYTQIKG